MKIKIFYSLALTVFVFMVAFPASAHFNLWPHAHNSDRSIRWKYFGGEEGTTPQRGQDTPESARETIDYSTLPIPYYSSSDTPRGVERTVCIDPTQDPHNYFEVALIAENDSGVRKIGSPDLRLTKTVADASKLGSSNDSILDAFRREGNLGFNLVAIGGSGRAEDALACTPINTLSVSVENVWYLPPTALDPTKGGAERFDASKSIDGFSFTQTSLQWGEEGANVFGSEHAQTGPLFRRQRSREASSVDVIPRLSKELKTGVYRLDYKFETVGYGTNNKKDTEIRYLYLYLIVNPKKKPADEDKLRRDIDEVIRISMPVPISPAPASQVPQPINNIEMSFSLWGEELPIAYQISDIFGTDNPCPEDLSGDGIINIIDLVTVARRFGQRNPIPRIAGNTVPWSPEDVNGDDVVNIIDLVTVARRFGQSCDAAAYNPEQQQRVVFVPVPIAKQPQNLGFASVLKSIFWVLGE